MSKVLIHKVMETYAIELFLVPSDPTGMVIGFGIGLKGRQEVEIGK